jgi:hypothetical protein
LLASLSVALVLFGSLPARADQDLIQDLDNRTLGYIRPEGENWRMLDETRHTLGYILRDGQDDWRIKDTGYNTRGFIIYQAGDWWIKDDHYETFGYVQTEGEGWVVKDKYLEVMGHVTSDGTVKDDAMAVIAYLGGNEPFRAAAYYFFMPLLAGS